jgi:hypothetical protein
MHVELDHLFVCSSPGAPEAEELLRLGLKEGPANQHRGQGTANRRFPFAGTMIELLWVSDATEARNECTRRTLLWERWSDRERGTSPFGFCVRPVHSPITQPPFPAWEYRPPYLPDSQCIHVAETGVEEPMWIYMNFMRRLDREKFFLEHPLGIRKITALTLTTPDPLRSFASQSMIEQKIVTPRAGEKHLLEIEFDANRRSQMADFRPRLPLLFRF